MKPSPRAKSVGTKVTEAGFAMPEERARAAGLTYSAWVRGVLLAAGGAGLRGRSGRAAGPSVAVPVPEHRPSPIPPGGEPQLAINSSSSRSFSRRFGLGDHPSEDRFGSARGFKTRVPMRRLDICLFATR